MSHVTLMMDRLLPANDHLLCGSGDAAGIPDGLLVVNDRLAIVKYHDAVVKYYHLIAGVSWAQSCLHATSS